MSESQPQALALATAWLTRRPVAAVPAAMARLGGLARGGAGPDALSCEVRRMVQAWHDDADATAMRLSFRAELLLGELRAACAGLAEEVDAADDDTDRRTLTWALAGLQAARDELIRLCGEMP